MLTTIKSRQPKTKLKLYFLHSAVYHPRLLRETAAVPFSFIETIKNGGTSWYIAIATIHVKPVVHILQYATTVYKMMWENKYI